ncbi:ComEC/Rec2 family competence protein [[Mycobacterium] wendilense]|uniref:ComEC/Rec2 family competence protein n=1 Tax=[Mycobacterium] wendilense TaxID=3064284 RepID=A0ABM9MC66_9MYCO|nr:ComEC/Rec2 family competence protein [Mycolicibacterium sp. MU0050]CAJ1581644.1 ComEC/Rec2 family competence protein [Mycolicibacterium sp. MU0050]
MRLVPAATVAWTITAAGTYWNVGAASAVLCLVIAAVAAGLRGRVAPERETARVAGAVVVTAALVGVGFGVAIGLRASSLRSHPAVDRYGTAATVTVVAAESPLTIGSGRVLIRANLRQLDDIGTRGRVVVFAPAQHYQTVSAGQPLRFRARVSKPTRRDLTVAALNATGEPTLGQPSAIHRAAAIVRSRLAERAREVLPAEQAAMLPALVLGDTSAVPPTATRQFRIAGLTHLTAVSGANVTIVCGAVLLAAGFLGPRIAVALAGLALVAFVVVVQPTASVLRAAVMGAIALLALVTARRRQAIPALAGTVLVLLVVAPQLAVDVGFALSVAATAALIVLAPRWSLRLVGRGWPKPVADAVAIAVAAQLVTAPLVAGISGMLSLVAVLANLLVTVVIAPITLLGTAAAAVGMVWPAAARLLIRFTGPELWWLLQVARWTSAVPHAAVPVPSGAVGVLVLAAATVAVVLGWGRRRARIALGTVGLVAFGWGLSALL